MAQVPKSDGTVGKALNVLDDLAAMGHPARFTDLLARNQLPKATLHRLLQTLTSQGMLSYDSERQVYSLGFRLVRLAHAAWKQSTLGVVARPHMDGLAQKVGETIHLAQLDNGQVLYVDKRNANATIEMFSEAGKIGPAYCTGIGKAMLAALDGPQQAHAIALQPFHAYTKNTITTRRALLAELVHIRKVGIALDREEHEPQIICAAVPILSVNGHLIGGISITGSTQRHVLEDLEKFKPALIDTAEKIARDAEYWRFPEQTSTRTA